VVLVGKYAKKKFLEYQEKEANECLMQIRLIDTVDACYMVSCIVGLELNTVTNFIRNCVCLTCNSSWSSAVSSVCS
jgi:hypothetical protein